MKETRIQRAAAIFVLPTLAAGAIATVAAAPANAADYGVSIAAYCERNVSSGNYWVKSKAVNVNNSWDGWRCAQANGNLVQVSVAVACSQQGGGQAVLVNRTASGWRCRR